MASLDSKATYQDLKAPLVEHEHPAGHPHHKLKEFHVESNTWIYLALMAGAFYGLSSFSFGKSATHSIEARLMFSFGKLFYTACHLGVKATKRDLPTPDFSCSTLFYVFVDSLLSFGGGMSMIVSLHVAIASGINQGVITCLFALQSIFLAIIGWLMFDEHIKWYHYAGICLMVSCATCIGFGKSGET